MGSIGQVFLEYAKNFEISNMQERALNIIDQVIKRCSEWKVHYDSVVMFMRIGNFVKAEEMVVQALKTYSGKGRLWSLLIQIEH